MTQNLTEPYLRLNQTFVGDRLRQVRELNGLSMEVLASRIGKSKQQISRYEKEEDVPPVEILQALATELQQPVAFFFLPLVGNQGLTFYRKLKRVTKPQLRRAAIWKAWLNQMIEPIDEYLELPTYDIPPDLFLLQNPADIDMAVIDEAALKLRKHWELGLRPIGNLVRTLERNGVLVSRFDLDIDDMEGFSFIRSGQRENLVIVLNAYKANFFRSRFDAAHELGHLVLHRNLTEEQIQNSEHYDRYERQAHRFASSFLLPEEALWGQKRITSPEALLPLKERWGISMSAIAYRMRDLDLMSEDDYRRFRANLSHKKWNKLEPLDASTDPEAPVLLQQSVDALIQHAGFTKEDVLTDVVLGARTVEKLASLPDDYFRLKKDLPALAPRNIRFPTRAVD